MQPVASPPLPRAIWLGKDDREDMHQIVRGGQPGDSATNNLGTTKTFCRYFENKYENITKL